MLEFVEESKNAVIIDGGIEQLKFSLRRSAGLNQR